jgi:hypothetical protein
MTVLKTAIATYPHTKSLKDGTVTAPGIEFEHVEITPIIAAFRRMCRRLEFDVAEMAITTYRTAKAYNKPFTALPVFVVRQFHHSPIVYNVRSGVVSPKDLEGKKVGVRAYTVTTGVWARGILATEYGVDLSKVTWVLADEEHVDFLAGQLRPQARIGRIVAEGPAEGDEGQVGPGQALLADLGQFQQQVAARLGIGLHDPVEYFQLLRMDGALQIEEHRLAELLFVHRRRPVTRAARA